LATAAVGLFGTLLSNWAFQAVDFVVGRTVLCLAGAFMVMSVRAAEKYAVVDPDSVLEELFQPITAEPQAPPARKEGGRETDDRWLYQRSMLLEVDPSSNYERAVRGFALEMASNGRELFVFTTSSSAVRVLLRDIPEIRFLILSDVSYPKASDRPLDVLVPSYDLAAILSVINETVTKAPGARKAIVFDNISSLIVELGFQNTYKFLKHVNEVLAQCDMISLFMMLAKAHDDSVVKLIRNLYSGHLTYDANGLGVTK